MEERIVSVVPVLVITWLQPGLELTGLVCRSMRFLF